MLTTTTPKANVLRTVLQVLVAVLIAMPIAVAKVPIPDKYQGSVALVLGICAGLVVLVVAMQNVIESHVGVALFRQPVAVPLAAPDDALPPGPIGNTPAQPRGPP